MRLVVLESPFRGQDKEETGRNVAYAQRCLLDCHRRGEAPIASHLLHTQVLNDNIKDERHQGIEAGLAWIAAADAVVVYVDYGISSGLVRAIERARQLDIPVEERSLEGRERA